MRTARRLGRTLAFEALFEMETRPRHDPSQALANRVTAFEEEMGEHVSQNALNFASSLLHGALQDKAAIDDRIEQVAPAFPIDQIAITDRVALEIAVYELLYRRGTPVAAVINEAVELAKQFGGDNSGRFVNGVLGTIAEERERPVLGRSDPQQAADHNHIKSSRR